MYELIALTILGELLGFATFLVFVGSRWRAHIKGVKNLLRFYIFPYPPKRMVRIIEIDSRERVYYDDFCAVMEEASSSRILCRDGHTYVVPFPFSKIAPYRRFYDLRAGEDVPSPISPLWRWIIARTVAIYVAYYVPMVLAMGVGGLVAEVYRLLMVTVFALFMSQLVRMGSRDTVYFAGLEADVSGGESYVVPIPSETRVTVIDFLKALGRAVTIRVPEEVRELYDRLREKLRSDAMAAIELVKILRSDRIEQAAALCLEEEFKIAKVGESHALISLKPFLPRVRMPMLLIVFVLGLVLGAIVGYVFGSTWGISFSPPSYVPQNASWVPAYQPPPPMPSNATTSVTPAMPPPPPPGG